MPDMKKKSIWKLSVLLLLISLSQGCNEEDLHDLPELVVISPSLSHNSFKEGETIEVVLSVRAEAGLHELYQGDTLISQWNEDIIVDEVTFILKVNDGVEMLEFRLVDVLGSEVTTTFSGVHVKLPVISGHPQLAFHLEVGEETTITLNLSAEAGLKELYLNDTKIEEWDGAVFEDEFKYTFTPVNDELYVLEFKLADADDDYSSIASVTISPKITVSVTFTVDMTGVDVSRGVFIGGEGFGFGLKSMTDQGNNTYSYQTSMIAGTEGHYYFLNGDEFAGIYYKYREEIPVRCAQAITDVATYRSFTISKDDKESGVTYVQSWGKCNDSENNDRIFLFGDSITALGNWERGYIQILEELLIDLGLSKDLIGVGISGNTVNDLQDRVQWDIVESDPDVVIVYIGINDLWVSEADQFEQDYDDLITTLLPTGARIILATPALVGEKKNGENPDDAKLDQFAEKVRSLATEHSLELIDLRKIFIDYLQTNNPNNEYQGILTTDGIHMSDQGNMLIAQSITKHITK